MVRSHSQRVTYLRSEYYKRYDKALRKAFPKKIRTVYYYSMQKLPAVSFDPNPVKPFRTPYGLFTVHIVLCGWRMDGHTTSNFITMIILLHGIEYFVEIECGSCTNEYEFVRKNTRLFSGIMKLTNKMGMERLDEHKSID